MSKIVYQGAESGSAQKNRAVRGSTATRTSTKRRRIEANLDEDPLFAPPAGEVYDELSRDLQEYVLEKWSSIRTHVVHGPVQTRYNRRLTSLNTRDLHESLHVLFEQQTTKFRINLSYGFILKQKQNGRFKYYHSSGNCCGRYLEEPSLIENRADFDQFLERIHVSDSGQILTGSVNS